jgi:hypothetical protein
MLFFSLTISFFAYAMVRTLFLLGVFQQKGYRVKALPRSLLIDSRIFLGLALIAVLAHRLPWIVWLAPLLLTLGLIMEKEEKLVLDARAKRIFFIAILLDFTLAFNIYMMLAPLFVLLVPLSLIIAGWLVAPFYGRKKDKR